MSHADHLLIFLQHDRFRQKLNVRMASVGQAAVHMG